MIVPSRSGYDCGYMCLPGLDESLSTCVFQVWIIYRYMHLPALDESVGIGLCLPGLNEYISTCVLQVWMSLWVHVYSRSGRVFGHIVFQVWMSL